MLQQKRTSPNYRISTTLTAAYLLILGIGTLPIMVVASDKTGVELKTTQQQAGYSIGYEFGTYLAELKRQGPGVELETVFQGVVDAMTGAQQRLSPEQMRTVLNDLKRLSVQSDKPVTSNISRHKQPARTGRNMDDYAKLNARRDGVVVLPSGVQYEVLKTGSGRQLQATDTVIVNYEGTLTNGVVFDSTYKDGKPAHMQLGEVAVPGLKEALLLMKAGDKWRVVIPPSMGFANSGNNLLRRRDLIYEIELIAIATDGQTTSIVPTDKK